MFGNTLVGKNVRTRWGGSGWVRDEMWIEELPGKPVKRKVRHMPINLQWILAQHLNRFMIENLADAAKLKKSMNYDQMVKAMKDAIEKAAEEYEGKPAGRISRFEFHKYGGVSGICHESTRSYLEVEPEDHKPITVKLSDGSALVSDWGSFNVYSPTWDPHSMDRPPFISSKSAGGARKLFKMLKADANALAAVAYMSLANFLRKNKIAYSWV